MVFGELPSLGRGTRMAKKTTERAKGKAVIYVEVDTVIKAAMEQLAAQHDRKLTGEVVVALKQYIAGQKAK
jgi:hypothetical protein